METIDREKRFQTICLCTLSAIAVAFALYWLRPVMIPFILAIFFSLIIMPLIDIQKKYFKVPTSLAVITTLVIGLLLLLTLGLLISASVTQMLSNFDSYQQKIVQILNNDSLNSQLDRFGIDPHEILNPMKENFTQSVGGIMIVTINSIVKLLSQGFLVLLFVCFLLIGKSTQTKPPSQEWNDGVARIKRFITTKLLISAITGILVGTILMLFGIDMALAFGLFAFLLNFIPSVGSVIATLLPLPVVLVSPDITPLVGTLAILIPGAIQFLIGNVLEPKIIGDALELHPVVILMALIFWGMIWGVVGMLLAAPLTAIMKIILGRIEYTAPIANLLSGKLDDLQS